MSNHDVDRDVANALSEPALVPSSGFVNAVMASVLAEASAPAPIPFPWRRFIPAAVAGFAAFAAPFVAWMFAATSLDSAPSSSPELVGVLSDLALRQDIQLFVAVLLLTAAGIELPRRLLARS